MKAKFTFVFLLIFFSSYAQTTTLVTPGTGTFKIPAGVTSLDVECWGAGGAGGGVTATLLSLWAGGGGGGGAYTRVPALTVIPGNVLNYKVGAGGIGINGANNGTDGEQTFFSTVPANGGVGGKFGNPVLGAGGAGAAASGIGISFSGGNGATAALLDIASINSGGGGGGAGATANGGNATNATAGTGGDSTAGAGGQGVAVLSDGNNGIAPGGGGSGGAALLALAGRKGGNGGNGQIKVTFTCPTYSLTGTTADGVCSTLGSTTTVRLTGGASLPDGDYVATYSRSNPAATGLTANMSVAGGIGTFTATGFTVVGSSTITVTNISSGVITKLTPSPVTEVVSALCTNIITSNNSVVITIAPASAGGVVSGGGLICNGSTSGVLTLAGHTGSVVKWQYAVGPTFSSWTDIGATGYTDNVI
jgi:hypothetical protein